MKPLSGQNQRALDSRDPRNAGMRGLDENEPFAKFRFVIVHADRVGLAIHGPEMDLDNGI